MDLLDNVEIMMAKFFFVKVFDLCRMLFCVHVLMVFYAKQFDWSDLHPRYLLGSQGMKLYMESRTTCWKAMACITLLAFLSNPVAPSTEGQEQNSAVASFGCADLGGIGWVTAQQGWFMTVLLAFPQLYRFRGRRSQELRVILGPLTPILSFYNVYAHCCPATITMGATSLLAFAAFRPDNVAVWNAIASRSFFRPKSMTVKTRRRLHAFFAACNGALALCFLLFDRRGGGELFQVGKALVLATKQSVASTLSCAD